jgi:Tfp pilus assembly protein PilF
MPIYSGEPVEIHFPKALKNARKALELDPTIAEAYAVLAELAREEKRWDEAENYYLKAIEMEPKNSTSHLWYAEHLLSTGRTEVALKEALTAYQLDPLHPGSNSIVGVVYASLDDDVNREKYSSSAWQLGHFGSLIDVIDLKIKEGNMDEAMTLAQEFEATVDGSNGLMILRVNVYANQSERQEFFDRIEAPDARFPPIFYLYDYAALGRLDDFFELTLDPESLKGNSMFRLWLTDMAQVRRDPRFADVIKAAGLESYWDEYGWPPACQRTDGQITCQ